MLRQLAPGLWIADHRQRLLGVEIGTRMTVVALRDGGLLVHAPVTLDSGVRNTFDALGAVRVIVAPNRFHHLYVAEYRNRYPAARVYAAPGLETKRRDVRFDGVVTEAALADLGGELEHLVFRAAPILNEVIFHHPASRTLVCTDVVTNVHRGVGLPARVLFRANGALGAFRVGRFERLLIRDRRLARRTVDRILGWDFDRVIMAHGDVLDTGGRRALAESFAWLT